MKIALIHYHLRPGGVTQVMLRQARALQEGGDEALALSGEPPPDPAEWEGVNRAVIPALCYDRRPPGDPRPGGSGGRFGPETGIQAAELARSIEEAIRSRWPGGAGLILVHNPLIRKNSLLMGALKELARRGPLLLQNHDLAEDFRPDVYSGEDYPENCHYAVINSRDRRFLLEAGLRDEGLHLIPNEVRSLAFTPGLPKTRYLYPVRGIRRKNIGEMLLLSLFIPGGSAGGGHSGPGPAATVALTQPPTTDQDAPIYRRWQALAAELALPAEFEAGALPGRGGGSASFADVVGTARAAITTSVKEGFGFSFLEPWTAGLAVTGRRLDYVCRDFEEAGLRFEPFYGALRIPAEYAEPERLRKKMELVLSGVYAAFGAALPPSISPALDRVFDGGDYLDFGIMDEETQEGILRRAAADKTVRGRIAGANPFLEALESWESDPALVEANRRAVMAVYSRERIGTILRESCRKALTPIVQRISRPRLLELYLDPARLSLTGVSPERP
ncbi:MAG: glycosyltransferase family 1 protein [Treponema sp.]|nr:glycosyltransferase family 1 protein [Treponema sp.]